MGEGKSVIAELLMHSKGSKTRRDKSLMESITPSLACTCKNICTVRVADEYVHLIAAGPINISPLFAVNQEAERARRGNNIFRTSSTFKTRGERIIGAITFSIFHLQNKRQENHCNNILKTILRSASSV